MNGYGYTNKRLKWAFVELAPMTVSGLNEVVAAFEFKKQAEEFARWEHGKYWRRRFSVERFRDR